MLLKLTMDAMEFEYLLLQDSDSELEDSAVQALVMLSEFKTPSVRVIPSQVNYSPPKYVDPIVKLKAQHALKENREKLAVFLIHNVTIEEFKIRCNSNSKSKQKMDYYAKKLKSLYALDSPKNRCKPVVIPMPQRQKAKSHCVNYRQFAR